MKKRSPSSASTGKTFLHSLASAWLVWLAVAGWMLLWLVLAVLLLLSTKGAWLLKDVCGGL
jgi:hypothetical protein